jgi:hypothetical protein
MKWENLLGIWITIASRDGLISRKLMWAMFVSVLRRLVFDDGFSPTGPEFSPRLCAICGGRSITLEQSSPNVSVFPWYSLVQRSILIYRRLLGVRYTWQHTTLSQNGSLELRSETCKGSCVSVHVTADNATLIRFCKARQDYCKYRTCMRSLPLPSSAYSPAIEIIVLCGIYKIVINIVFKYSCFCFLSPV